MKEEFLIFRMFGVMYGVRLSRVREIITYSGKITPLPNNPAWILGVINMRGEVTPVIDFRRKFSAMDIVYDDETIIIAMKLRGDRVMAIVADNIETIAEMDADSLQAASDIGSGLDTRYLEGLARLNGEMISVINVDVMLDINERF
ncbi:MAG: chemotaxis protein CheW [Helicobacteraceae bacterium]|jgi:purine-binding chemotaxis protein CheW|nr:chemotaxis protein CheW [Helicobacteraceae bacterium]